MSGLVQYNSSDSSDSDSDSDSSDHERSLAVKRQKVAFLGAKVDALINESTNGVTVKKNDQSQSSNTNESRDPEQRDTNSISLFLPAPKRQNNNTNNNNATIKQQTGNSDIQHASLSHITRTLGGGIKNQFNGAGIVGRESDDSDDGNSDNNEYNPNQDSLQNINVRSSISFLPSSLLRKKKLGNNSQKKSDFAQRKRATESELAKSGARELKQVKANDQEDEFTLDATTLFPTTANTTASTISLTSRHGMNSSSYNEKYVAPSISSHPDEIPRPSIISDPLTTATNTAKLNGNTAQFGQIPKDKKIIEFNVDDFYSTNNELLRTGQLQQVDAYSSGSNTIKNINVNGRNQLSSLVKFAQDEENSQVLKEKFEKEKQGKRKIRERYGW